MIKEIAEILVVSICNAGLIAKAEKWERHLVSNRNHGAPCYFYKVTREELEALKERRAQRPSPEQIAQMRGQALARLEAAFNRIQTRRVA